MSVRFDESTMWVSLEDGRTLGVPIAWFPRLLRATPEQRLRFELSLDGIHWEELDEDISVEGFLAGRGDQSRIEVGSDAWMRARGFHETTPADDRKYGKFFNDAGKPFSMRLARFLYHTRKRLKYWWNRWPPDYRPDS